MENLWSVYCQETMSSFPSCPAFWRNPCVIIVGWDWYGERSWLLPHPTKISTLQQATALSCQPLYWGKCKTQEEQIEGITLERHTELQGWGCIFLPSSFWRKQRQSTQVVIQITLVTVEEISIKGHSPLVVGYLFHVCERKDMACEKQPELVLHCTFREANSQVMDTQRNMKYICYWHMSITIPFLVLLLIQDLTKNETFLLSFPKPVLNLFQS